VGACSGTGGLNCLKNLYGTEKAKELVYGDKKGWIDAIDTKPIDAFVKVDYYARGCPPTRSEIVDIVKSLIVGKTLNSQAIRSVSTARGLETPVCMNLA
jgi:sulfhydrogenase subunit delta